MTVLIIEDSVDILENTAELLALEGYQTLKATNGAMGVELALNNRPDIVISDIIMPEFDGYYVARELSINQYTSHIPIIFCTALAEQKDKLKGISLGADGYIVKPYRADELLSEIRRCAHTSKKVIFEPKELLFQRRYEVVSSLTA